MQKENILTVGQWCDRWFTTNRYKWNGNTEGGYRNLIYSHIRPGIGSIELTDLTEQMVTGFYDDLRSQGLSARTVWCVHLLLRRCMDEAVRDQLIPYNPYNPVRALPRTPGGGIQNSPSAPGSDSVLPEHSGTDRRTPSHLHRTIKRPAAM